MKDILTFVLKIPPKMHSCKQSHKPVIYTAYIVLPKIQSICRPNIAFFLSTFFGLFKFHNIRTKRWLDGRTLQYIFFL